MPVDDSVLKLKVEGMTCTGCASTIENYLAKKGVSDISIDFVHGDVSFKSQSVDLDALIAGIDKLGYKVVTGPGQAKKSWGLQTYLIVSLLFTVPLILSHFFPNTLSVIHRPAIQFLLALPPFIIGMMLYLPGAIKSFRSLSPNMDVTICMGAMAAMLYSLIGWIKGDPNMIFFETAASIMTLVILGKYIEQKAVHKTTSAIDDLQKLHTQYGKMQMPSGTVVKIHIDEIHRGDLLLVSEGDAVPADGKIVRGEAQVDESWISGESSPVSKKTGDEIIGASKLLSGNLTIQVTRVGHQSALGKIIELVRQAGFQKAPIQTLADKISAIFVPVILALSAITFLLNFYILDAGTNSSILRAIAVLVISCPCAMGLATPTAVMVGLGKALRNGILIKGASSLEMLGKIKQVIFDKTGTLTTPEAHIHIKDKAIEHEIWSVLYNMELKSNHPLSQVILSQIPEQFRKVDDALYIVENKGKGLTAQDKQHHNWFVGWIKDYDNIQLMKEGRPVAEISIIDQLKQEAPSLINYISNQGIQVHMVSGDLESKVKKTAELLGISSWKGRVPVDQKVDFIKEVKKNGMTMMVGDGINDAPALTHADLGASFSQASYAAIGSSQLVLMNENLGSLRAAMAIGKQTLRTIKQNLFWAFSYNLIAIPLAALGYLNPMWGALFMAFSDLVVVGNSLRIKWTKTI